MAYEKENANAMTSFQWKRKLENILVFFNLCASLWFFWRSSLFPLTVQTFWFSYAKLMLLFSNSFYTFLLLNAILVSLYALSNRNLVGGSSDFYNEFLKHSESCFKITETTENVSESSDKAITRSEFGECSPVLDEKTVTAVTETTTTTTCCTTVSRKNRTTTTTGEKVSEKKCYRKIKSESSIERRVAVAPGKELKRYNTGFSRQVQGRLCYVEQLSKEEFNRAVEDFIAKHKRMQLEQQRESQEKTEYMV